MGFLCITIYKTYGIHGIAVKEFNLALRNPLNYLHPPALAMLIAPVALLNFKYVGTAKGNQVGISSPLFGLNYVAATATLGVSLGLSMWWAQQELFWGTF